MASDNISVCQDEKAALFEGGSEKDEGLEQLCWKRSDTKLTLYHWTQSFNSQKVSVDVSAPPCPGQLLVSMCRIFVLNKYMSCLRAMYDLISICIQVMLIVVF